MENIAEQDPLVQIIENVYRVSDLKVLFYFLKKHFVPEFLPNREDLDKEYVQAREFGFKRLADFAMVYLKDNFEQ